MTYEESCQYLEHLHQTMPSSKTDHPEHTLKRCRDLFERFGNPDRSFRCVHVTGTGGKGSVTHLLAASLKAAGFCVGSTLSPATTTTIERISVNGRYMSPEHFAALVEKIIPTLEDMHEHGSYGRPSYFEILFLIACLYFREQACDWVVLEVGMGGRFDATNIIDAPALAIITYIDLDHTHILGSRYEDIAYEKAGIIKTGSSCLTAETKPSIRALFRRICEEKKVPYFELTSADLNRSLVEKACELLGVDIAFIPEDIKLPCRLERMQNNPIIILDGAHNVSKVRYAEHALSYLQYEKLHLVFGSGEQKDALAMIDILAPYAASITLTATTRYRGASFSLALIQEHLRLHYPALTIDIEQDPHRALSRAESHASRADLILVTGSLYLAGHIRERWYPRSYILEERSSF